MFMSGSVTLLDCWSSNVMISTSLNSCVSLAIFVIIPVLFCFVFEHKTYTPHKCWLRFIFITVDRLAIQLSVKAFKTRTDHFRLLSEDFRLCSRYNNVNYGAWHVYKPLLGSSVPICRLACSEKNQVEVPEKVGYSTPEFCRWRDSFSSAQYSRTARSFNQ